MGRLIDCVNDCGCRGERTSNVGLFGKNYIFVFFGGVSPWHGIVGRYVMHAAQQRLLSHLALLAALFLLLLSPAQPPPQPPLPPPPERASRWRLKRPAYTTLGACEAQADPLAAPAEASASPTPLPTLRAAPAALGDAAFAAARAARQARETAQCNQTFSALLADAAPRLIHCADFARAVRGGRRERPDGPFRLAPPCRALFFSPAEACDLLQAQGRLVILAGDSLMRHLQQGLFMALSGSFWAGGVPPEAAAYARNVSLPPDASCTCERGFSYACREETFAYWTGPAHWVCPKWGTQRYLHPVLTLSTAADFDPGEGWDALSSGLDWGEQLFEGTTLVINVGLHDNLDARHVAENVYNVLLERVAWRAGRARTRVICSLMPAPEDAKRRNEHVGTQGTGAVLEFNERMRRVCLDRGAEVFEAYAATEGMSTFDGLHFGMAGNVLQAQLLLNQIAQGQGWERAVAALGEGFL